MKKASRFLKQLFSAIVAAVRESSAAMRSKTSAVRTRLIFLGILRNRKLLMSSISSKIHALVAGAAQAQAQQHGNNNNNNGAGLVAARGKKKAAVLQSLPSFAADDQDRRRAAAVLLLNSLPSFAMGRGDTGGSCPDSPLVVTGGEEEGKEEGGEEDGKQLQLQAGSVIELARGAAERGGVEFRLEDEIDRVADVFIRRFHDQMKLQKLDSFKRFCEMLDRN